MLVGFSFFGAMRFSFFARNHRSIISLFALQTDTFHGADGVGQIGFIVFSLVFSLAQRILILKQEKKQSSVGRVTSAAAAEQQFFKQIDNLQ